MKNFTQILLAFNFLFLISLSATATHNQAGMITFQQTGALTFEVTCTTYTKASSPADRNSLVFDWGDGSSETVVRSNGSGIILNNDTKFNIYTATHTYPNSGQFTVSMIDPNRNGGILNVNPPNSDQVPFYIETTFEILNNSFQGMNNSPIISQSPVDVAYLGQVFEYTPNAFDAEGDSIAYALAPIGSNYIFPHDYDNQLFSFSETTGLYTWNTAQTCGEYSLRFLIKEYRAGQLISTITQDIQILVKCLNNRPPVVTTSSMDEICVFAGELINFDVITTDLDNGQKSMLSATGGPFMVQNAAQLFSGNTHQTLPATNQFVWQTDCNHIRKEPYQIVFKAQDDFENDLGGVDLKVIRIRVIPSLPENVQTNVQPTQIELTWDDFYTCDSSNNFSSFSIWRQECNTTLPVDSCILDLGIENYDLIANNISTLAPNGSGSYYYLDTDIENGKTYCYRVLANFGFLLNNNPIISNDNFNVNYYPNPIQSGDWLRIEMTEYTNDLTYEVHNLLGQKVDSGVLMIDNQTTRIEMPIQENIYIISLFEARQKVKSFKVVVKN